MAAERYQDFSRSKLAQRLRYYHGHHISCWNSKYISTRNSSWASQLKLCFSIIDHIERSNWDIWRAIFLCLVSDSWVQQYWRITSLSLNINHYNITHPLVNKILHQHEHYVCVFWMRLGDHIPLWNNHGRTSSKYELGLLGHAWKHGEPSLILFFPIVDMFGHSNEHEVQLWIMKIL